jgi:transcriptional regulator with GAF, ATPase, and Fis domain
MVTPIPQKQGVDSMFVMPNLKDEIGDLARKRIRLALIFSDGNVSNAARLLGFANYQTLNNWVKRYNVRESDNDQDN